MADLSPFDLTGKVAIVTGAARGIGQGIALALAQAGADIVGVDLDGAGETKTRVEAMGRKFLSLQADLTKQDKIPELTKAAVAEFGHIDILVNNAGLIRREDSVNFTEADWDLVMNINLKTVFFFCQAFGKCCIENGRPGKIVNIASMLSFQGGIRVPSYTASKSGVAGITKLLCNEWAAKGVNVNALAPGYVATANTAQLRADENRSAEILGRIPVGRWSVPSDLGWAAVFLASAAADYIHGTILPVDGGWLAR